MNFLRAIFGNPGLKLLSLLLAWSVWTLVRGELEDKAEIELPLSIEVEGRPHMDAALADFEAGWTPKLTVLGSKTAIASLKSAAEPVVLLIPENALARDLLEHTQTMWAKDLKLPALGPDQVVRVIGMEPVTFQVDIWRVEERSPAVDSRIEIRGLERVSDKLTFVPVHWPPSLTLRGKAMDMKVPSVSIYLPEAKIEDIEERFGFRMREEFSVRYELVDEGGLFEIVEPEQLEGKVAVTYRHEQLLAVPIELHMMAGDTRTLVFPEINETDDDWIARNPTVPGDTNKLRVRFEGSPRALKQLDDAETVAAIRAHVISREFPPDATSKYLQVHFSGLPDGVIPAGEYEVGVELR